MHEIEYYLKDIEQLDAPAFCERFPNSVLIYRGGLQVNANGAGGFLLQQRKVTTEFIRSLPEAPVVHVNTVFEMCKQPGTKRNTRICIGRAVDNDVQLPLPRVSRFHAHVRWSRKRSIFVITDVGAANGTQVDETSAVPNVPIPLHDGASVALGPYQFLFLSAESFYTFARTLKGHVSV